MFTCHIKGKNVRKNAPRLSGFLIDLLREGLPSRTLSLKVGFLGGPLRRNVEAVSMTRRWITRADVDSMLIEDQ